MDKTDSHAAKVEEHAKDHLKQEALKGEQHGELRMERHPANGATIKPIEKKGGSGGKGTWGSVQDEIKEGLEEVQSS